MPSRFLRARTAVVAGLAMLSLGGVAAAATGLAPAASERAATAASSRTSGGQLGHAYGDAAAKSNDANAAAASSSDSDKSADHARGPDASGAARHGLCQAWSAGQGDDHGQRTDTPAFQALAAAAGGADQVAAYCQAELDASATQGRGPATPPATGPPERPGQGQGHGGPPTTS